MASANSLAEPTEEFVFVSFHEHRLTTDPEERNEGVVTIELAIEPVCPLRDAWKTVDMSERGSHKRRFRMSQRVRPVLAEATANSSDTRSRVAQLACGL